MSLNEIRRINTERKFLNFLERHTVALSIKFPKGARGNWGAARKALNVFLRDCLYNNYLNSEYKIDRLENWLEIPLDKDVAKKLYSLYEDLPRWKSIKSLDEDTSIKYQDAAYDASIDEGVAKIHLDIKYWRNGEYN